MNIRISRTVRAFINSRTAIVVSMLAAVFISTGVVVAYGPERPTFTTQNPATYITFDSITNNGAFGDERNFLVVKDASITTSGSWKDNITVENGKEYLVRVVVHNNAQSNLNLVATNTRVAVNVPTDFGTSATLDGFVRADNSNPKEIWDNAVLSSDKKFNVSYVLGSARYFNNLNLTDGFKLSDNIITDSGAKVGYEQMDGRVQGCYEYSGYVIFRVKVTMNNPNFKMTKMVRLHGTSEWHKSITAKAGQKVDYQIYYENTGEAFQQNVAAIDKLPSGVKYTNGSTTLRNAANHDGDGAKIISNDLTTKGINIGDYHPVSNAYVRFTATLPKSSELASCGANKLINTGTIVTENGEKSDTATVTINKPCAAGELPTTGPIEVIAGLAGIAAITIGVVYYFKSRRELGNVLLHAEGGKKGSVVDLSNSHHHDTEHKS